ncbi:MAG: ABC transporter ATP-binding protein [Anaerolineae bacterium]|nr:ABC transporter ATP-binding protein [Anaerolineae bacterium]
MLLEIKNVSKSFGGLLALSNLSFTVAQGDVVGLIGPNGSGKSTAFNIVAGTFPPTSGQVFLQGKEITGLSAHQVSARGIARSFQLVRPFLHLTALQNVMTGRLYGHHPATGPKQAKAEALEILEFIGLAGKHAQKASSLTVMERKWLEMGRALATRPKLLLLDEFMAGLTPTEVTAAMKLISGLKEQDITVIVVEHIVKAVMNLSNHVVVLNAGTKIAEGTPDEVSRNPQVIKAYLGDRYAAR